MTFITSGYLDAIWKSQRGRWISFCQSCCLFFLFFFFFFVQVPDCDYFYIIKILSSIHGLITLIGGGVLKVKGFGEARV